MSEDHRFVSPALLEVMRASALIATELREPFITMRALLLALLDEPQIGAAIARAVPREALEAYEVEPGAIHRMTASRVLEPQMEAHERAALARFNTLAFKVPDGSRSVWLSREAYSAFCEGGQRVEEDAPFAPKHLAYGIAADAVRAPGLLTTLQISPGALTDALGRG
ncbi:MAG: hypothetical protein M3N13_03870 [Candidatus Eremiobacteraeota bacterium]|nr:hypothetical protein [Candidatus Eremiobacteraeota bacterium]